MRSKENAYRIYETRFEIYDNIIFVDDLMINIIIIIKRAVINLILYYRINNYYRRTLA